MRYVAVSDAEMNIRRVQARAVAGGHWIDPDTVRRRVAGSLDNLAAAIAIADRAVLLDNSGSSHRRVLDVERGRVAFEAPDRPGWLAAQPPTSRPSWSVRRARAGYWSRTRTAADEPEALRCLDAWLGHFGVPAEPLASARPSKIRSKNRDLRNVIVLPNFWFNLT